MSGSIDCPACGAPIDVEDRFLEYIECPYCQTQSYIGDATKALAADASGKAPEGAHATLADVYSRFQVGQSGSVDWGEGDKMFSVEERLQFEYDGGYWSEWYLNVEGTGYWIHEDEGVYIMFIELPVEQSARLEDLWYLHEETPEQLKIGLNMPSLNSQMSGWQLMEFGTARLLSTEGNIPRTLSPGYSCLYYDGAGGGYRYTLELSDQGKTGVVHQGWPLEFESINVEESSDYGDW